MERMSQRKYAGGDRDQLMDGHLVVTSHSEGLLRGTHGYRRIACICILNAWRSIYRNPSEEQNDSYKLKLTC